MVNVSHNDSASVDNPTVSPGVPTNSTVVTEQARDIYLGSWFNCYYCGERVTDVAYKAKIHKNGSNVSYVYLMCDTCAHILYPRVVDVAHYTRKIRST